MTDGTPATLPLDASIPPYVPPEADDNVRSVLRTRWARRWAPGSPMAPPARSPGCA